MRVADMVSSLREFLEGFPQGTVLGPVFWDLFMDDIVPALNEGLPAGARAEVVLYADDITAILRGVELGPLYARAQRVLENLSEWEVANEALVSLEKTSVTVFTPGPNALPKAEPPRPGSPTRTRPRSRLSG